MGWLAFEMTDSPLKVGVVMGIRSFPLLFSPLSGVLADRFDRRLILMINQAALAAVALGFAAMVVADVVQEWHLYAFSFLSGIAWSTNNPVRQVLVGNSVPREEMMNAIALNSVAFNIMRMVGPAVAGLLIVFSGAGINFMIQGLMYVGVFIVLIPFRPDYVSPRPKGDRQSAMGDLVEGFRYVASQRLTLLTMTLTLVPTLAMSSFIMTQMPVYAATELGDPEGGTLGVLFGFMGMGGFLGTLFVARFCRIQRKGVLVLVSVAGAGVSMLVLSQVDALWQASVLLVAQQAFFMVIMTTNNTIIQSTTPDYMRGRVMGVYMLDIGMQPLGGVVAGLLATWYGVPIAWVVGSVTGIGVVLLIALLAPSYRRLRI